MEEMLNGWMADGNCRNHPPATFFPSDGVGVDRARKIIVEVQSERFHSSLLDRERDKARIAALRAAGWTVVEIREHDVWYDPDKVVRILREAFWVKQAAR